MLCVAILNDNHKKKKLAYDVRGVGSVSVVGLLLTRQRSVVIYVYNDKSIVYIYIRSSTLNMESHHSLSNDACKHSIAKIVNCIESSEHIVI